MDPLAVEDGRGTALVHTARGLHTRAMLQRCPHQELGQHSWEEALAAPRKDIDLLLACGVGTDGERRVITRSDLEGPNPHCRAAAGHMAWRGLHHPLGVLVDDLEEGDVAVDDDVVVRPRALLQQCLQVEAAHSHHGMPLNSTACLQELPGQAEHRTKLEQALEALHEHHLGGAQLRRSDRQVRFRVMLVQHDLLLELLRVDELLGQLALVDTRSPLPEVRRDQLTKGHLLLDQRPSELTTTFAIPDRGCVAEEVVIQSVLHGLLHAQPRAEDGRQHPAGD